MTASKTLIFSPLESQRFGLQVFRADKHAPPDRAFLKEIVDQRADVVLMRIQTSDQVRLSDAQRLGFPFLIADTQVVAFADLTTVEPQPLADPSLEFVPCQLSDIPILDEMVSTIFTGYRNHYSANPYLKGDILVPSYQEWTRSFIDQVPNGKHVWLIMKDQVPASFVTSQHDGIEGIIVLGGVLPSFAGRGIYRDFIRYNMRLFKDLGCRKVRCSTQIGNFSVQKTWTNEGFREWDSYYDVHLNPLLSTEGQLAEAWVEPTDLSGAKTSLTFMNGEVAASSVDRVLPNVEPWCKTPLCIVRGFSPSGDLCSVQYLTLNGDGRRP